MITTARSIESNSSSYEREGSFGVGLLEKKIPSNYSEFVDETKEESFDEAKIRMQRNLDKILNYDKYCNEEKDAANTMASDTVVEAVNEATKFSDEDIRPTSTTMQFGDGDVEQVFNDLNRSKEEAHEYKLNGKGKLVVALYVVAMAVVLALIVLNTGILAVLSERNTAKSELLSVKASEYSSLNQEINQKMSKENIINIAENEYGMIIK